MKLVLIIYFLGLFASGFCQDINTGNEELESTTIDNNNGATETTTIDNNNGATETTTIDNNNGATETTTIDNNNGGVETATTARPCKRPSGRPFRRRRIYRRRGGKKGHGKFGHIKHNQRPNRRHSNFSVFFTPRRPRRPGDRRGPRFA